MTFWRKGRRAHAGPETREIIRRVLAEPRWSLTHLSLFFGLAALVVIAGLTFATALVQRADRAAAAHEQAEFTAELIAGGLAERLRAQTARLDRLARDAQLADALARGEPRTRAEQEARLHWLFPEALAVRLLPPGRHEVDPKASPPISYATLDQLHQAESAPQPPPAEVQRVGRPDQHVSLARAIRAGDGRVVGDLLVSLPMRLLRIQLPPRARFHGRVELRQQAAGAPVTLTGAGPRTARRGPPAVVRPIPGSRWQLAVWAPPVPATRLPDTPLLAAAFAGLALLLAAAVLGPWAYRRGLAGDQALLLRALRDVHHGGLKSEYPIRMVESLPLLKGLVQLFAEPPAVSSATAGTPSPTPAPSPAAPEPEPADPFEVFDEQALQAPPATPPAEAPEDHARPAAPTAAGTAEPPPVDPALFRAYDIRGIHGRTLTAEVAEQIGRAVGSDALARGETALFVGRDGRLSSPELAAALIRGLCATGIQVKDLGEVPTPVLYYAAHRGEESSSGVMVTGSHNPPEYNGMKIVIAGETLHGAAIQALRHLIEHQTFMQGRGGVESVALVEDYVQAVTADVRLARPLRVAVDCSHGVTAHVVPRLLSALGCEAFPIHCEVDGRFPAHPPDPGHPEHLAGLVQAVQAHQADIGIAFDGDGDRLGVVDSEGNYIWPDRLMMLLAMDVLSRNPGADILFDVKCSRHLPRIIRDFGGNPEMWKTGHSRLKARMKETGALLAGELSGHLFYADRWYGFDDALYAAARLLEILAADHRPSARIFAVLPASPATPLIEVPVPEGEGPRLVERLREAAEFPDAEEVITLDGLRVEFADGWGLVRASNTTPALTLRFEADDAAALERIQQRFRDLLQTVAPGITLPF